MMQSNFNRTEKFKLANTPKNHNINDQIFKNELLRQKNRYNE